MEHLSPIAMTEGPMEVETFKPHPLYRHILVGTHGGVKYDMLYYNTQCAANKQECLKKETPSVGFHKEGYLTVNLTLSPGVHKHFLVHRLVADTYCIKPKSNEELFVNHIDGNKHNNFVSNLEWVTLLENNLHFCNTLRTENQKGFLYDAVTVYQYDLDGNLVATHNKLSSLSKGYSIGRISIVCNNEDVCKLYKGYFWSYTPIKEVKTKILENLNNIFKGNLVIMKSGIVYSRITRKKHTETLGPFNNKETAKKAFIERWLELYKQEFCHLTHCNSGKDFVPLVYLNQGT